MKRLIPRRIKDLILKVFHSNSSTEEVADGLAIGVFIAMLPILGIQMYVSLVLTRLFRKNTLIALAAAWITNPFTAVPIYLFNLWVGKYFYNGDVSYAEIYSIVKSLDFENILSAGKDILIPLWLGSTIVGIAMAFISQKLCLFYYKRIRHKILETKEAIHFRKTQKNESQEKPGTKLSR